MERSLVSVDDPETWPVAVREWSIEYGKRLRDTTAYTGDLAVPLEREDELRTLLGGQKLIAFHCTRLLDHEVGWIRDHGLRQLTRELVQARIDGAYEHGYLTADERDLLQQRNVFAVDDAKYRENQVSLVLGRSGLDDSGVVPLMSRWGGEAIYFVDPDSEARAAFLGRPTVVAAAIDLGVSHTVSPSFPSLGKLFVGTLLGTEHPVADVLLRSPVPAEDILDLWQPGHDEYDRHQTLPRA